MLEPDSHVHTVASSLRGLADSIEGLGSTELLVAVLKVVTNGNGNGHAPEPPAGLTRAQFMELAAGRPRRIKRGEPGYVSPMVGRPSPLKGKKLSEIRAAQEHPLAGHKLELTTRRRVYLRQQGRYIGKLKLVKRADQREKARRIFGAEGPTAALKYLRSAGF